jgi:tetratricopeptide (TPR) repeat protein
VTDYRYIRLAAPPAPPPSAPRGRSVVAAIGIDHYAAWPRLHNAVNDARGAARAFRDLGFVEVTGPLLDGAATGEAMRRLVTADLAELSPDDDLVVFFAGHGHTDIATFDDVSVKTGYVIPADAAAPDGRDGATWLRLDSWLSDVARLPPRHILVIVDACNSGVALSALHKWRDSGAAPTDELEALRARRSRCVITSALDDQRAMDGGPRPGHSLFTGCLIEGLSGGLADGGQRVATGREIGQYLQKRVRSYPHTTQTPDFGAFELDDRGDIVVPILRTTGLAGAPGVRLSSTETGFAGERERPLSVRTRRRWAATVAGAVAAIGASVLVGSTGVGDGAAPRHEPAVALAPAPEGPLEIPAIEIPAIEIQGMVLEPHAIRQPWVPTVAWPPFYQDEDALEKQRGLVRRTKNPVRKQALTTVLAAMLYRAASPASSVLASPAMRDSALLAEARRLLREVVQGLGDRTVDETTWRLLGTCDLLVGDYPAAEKTWQALVDRYPDSKDEPSHRAWLVYALLKQFKNTAALAAVAAERLDARHPELAYVTAWARWRAHDNAGAWEAMTAAVQRWDEAAAVCRDDRHACIVNTSYMDRRPFEREVRLLAGHANASLDQAMAVFAVLAPDGFGGARVQRYELLRWLGLGYGRAGRWTSGVAALDKAIEIGGNDIPPDDRVAIRAAQADFTVRLDTPELTAKYAVQAIDALSRCDTGQPVGAGSPTSWALPTGASIDDLPSLASQRQLQESVTAQGLQGAQRQGCLKVSADTVQRLHTIAQLFYQLHEATNDHRYYQPTYDLFAMTIPLLGNGATRARAQQEMRKLEAGLAQSTSANHALDRTALHDLLVLHDEEVTACYEASLTAHPALTGGIALALEVDGRGAVQRATARPIEGGADLTAVAGCIAERARGWKLPVRGGARLTLSYTLSVSRGN